MLPLNVMYMVKRNELKFKGPSNMMSGEGEEVLVSGAIRSGVSVCGCVCGAALFSRLGSVQI